MGNTYRLELVSNTSLNARAVETAVTWLEEDMRRDDEVLAVPVRVDPVGTPRRVRDPDAASPMHEGNNTLAGTNPNARFPKSVLARPSPGRVSNTNQPRTTCQRGGVHATKPPCVRGSVTSTCTARTG
jgi:hypothetical protein